MRSSAKVDEIQLKGSVRFTAVQLPVLPRHLHTTNIQFYPAPANLIKKHETSNHKEQGTRYIL